MLYHFDYKKHTTIYKNSSIQTYEFGQGDNVVFSFPSFPHSGVYYLWFLTQYDTSKVRFITFDLPGWAGYSDNIFGNSDFSIDEYVEIAKAVIKDYKVDKFSVIGYSFGGAMALKLAADCKEQIKRIVLVSSVINSNIIKRFSMSKLIKLVHYLKYYTAIKLVVFKDLKKISKILIDEEGIPLVFVEMYKDMVKHINSKVIAESLYKLFSSDYTSYLREIKDKEVLIVNSKDEERLYAVQAEYIRRILSNEKSLYIHGKHEDFIQRSRRPVVKEVVKFLIG